MTIEDKEQDICSRFPSFSRLMENFRISRDLQIQQSDANPDTELFRKEVRESYHQNYERLLDVIIELAPKATTP